MTQYKTPGVYVVEPQAFGSAVVPVSTAVPAFLGYTEKTVEPVRIASMAEYEAKFGGPAPLAFTYAESNGGCGYALQPSHGFVLHASLQLYFMNGGDPCFVASVGSYAATPSAADFAAALAALEKVLDVTLVVAPDVAGLAPEVAAAYPALALAHCGKLQSRVAILDVPNGDQPRSTGADDPITSFRASVAAADPQALSYGAAYYPWLNTTVMNGVDFRALSPASLPVFKTALQREAEQAALPADQLKALTHTIASLAADMPDAQAKAADHTLASSLGFYQQVMQAILTRVNLLPPSGAMAGIYCSVDRETGVFKAPANIAPLGVTSPAVTVSQADQEDLNTPPDGKAVNAIRTFPGIGTLVWGARTLDGNSDDFRYINVRRTLIMLEQSIKQSLQAYVFAPNDATTWTAVNATITAFLTEQWKVGVLQGASAFDAFSVSVGLGATMTGEDILNGLMQVMVKAAVVRPAEFIVFTFQQQMATS